MKKLLLSVFIIIITTTLPFFSTYAFEFSQLTPKDTDRHWAESSLSELMELGIMNGYDGFLTPNKNITRGEFAAILSRAFCLEKTEDVFFTDVGREHMFYDHICALKNAGIIGGYPDGSFKPGASVTREEIVLMVSKLSGKSYADNTYSFGDISASYPYLRELSIACEDKILTGFPDGSFRPYGFATRAQCSSILLSCMKKYIPGGEDMEIIEAASDFLVNHFSNIHSNLIGSAKADSEYIADTYEKAAGFGYVITNKVNNILYPKMEKSGPFTVMEARYDVECSIAGKTKKYSGYSEIKLLTRNGKTSVYSHTAGIKKGYPINLTWEVYSSPPSYETYGINTVSPTCFRVSSEKRSGETVSEIYAENGSGLFFNSFLKEDYVSYAHEKSYEVWAMYKTDFKTATANTILNSPAMRRSASDKLLEYILKFSLDGINFDFENMYEKDRGAYTNHVKEITLMAHTLGAAVSVCVNRYEPTSSTWSMCYDRNALGKICDYVALMAYDQFYSASKTPGPVAGMQWTEKCINTTLEEVSPQKLLLGMPYYIRCWEIKNSKAVRSFTVSMETALGYVEKFGIQPEYDARYMLNRYQWIDNGKQFEMWSENADTIRNRVRLSKKYNLAGVASWRRGFETQDVWYGIYDELY